MSLMKRILTAGDTVSSVRAADGHGRVARDGHVADGSRVAVGRAAALPAARGRTVSYALLAVVAISVAAQFAVPIPGTPVPVSLQDLVVMLIGVTLGPVAGTSAVITYLGAGAAGAPVFSNGHAGILWLFGPTGGYLLAYPVACCVVGMAARATREQHPSAPPTPHRRVRILGGVLLAQVIIFGGGISQLIVLTGQSLDSVLSLAVVPFIPGAVLKIAFVLAFAEAWRKWRAPARPY
jgi:biotin transport system substrate-specific component